MTLHSGERHAAHERADDDNGGRKRPPRRRLLRVLGWVSVVMTAILVAGSLTAYAAYRKLYGNISHTDVSGKLGNKRPAKLNKATNILLIGSDSRAGKNARIGGHDTGQRSDTMILLHVSPGGKHAVAVSFPRDSMVKVPPCTAEDGATIPGHFGQINATFDYGPACTWKTIESLTKVRIDHFITIDFTGFETMTKAIGGVEVCLPKAVHDRDSHLNLSAGKHLVSGASALAYVRNRHGLGDGSDLSRIKRQQLFLGSMVKKVTSGDLLTSPTRLYRFLDAATKAVTTDKGLGIGEMRKLAGSVKGIGAGKVRFVTVPVVPYAPDPNRVSWNQIPADKLFSAIRSDNISAARHTHKSGTKKAAKPTLKPGQVKVRVLNGTTKPGVAGTAADKLRKLGFDVVKVGNAAKTGYTKSEVRYGTAGTAALPTLTAKLNKATPKKAAGAHGSALTIVIGTDWAGVKSSTHIPKNLGGYTGNSNICQKT